MNRSASYLVIITLAVIAVVASLELYRQHQRESGIEISVGGKSISIEKR
jgi:hypothetical protein